MMIDWLGPFWFEFFFLFSWLNSLLSEVHAIEWHDNLELNWIQVISFSSRTYYNNFFWEAHNNRKKKRERLNLNYIIIRTIKSEQREFVFKEEKYREREREWVHKRIEKKKRYIFIHSLCTASANTNRLALTKGVRI